MASPKRLLNEEQPAALADPAGREAALAERPPSVAESSVAAESPAL